MTTNVAIMGLVRRVNAKGDTKTTKKVNAGNIEFAVIFTGGKQYKVAVGDVLKIEKIDGEYTLGDEIIFDKVLLVDNGVDTTIGTPYIKGASVESLFQKAGKGKTVSGCRFQTTPL